MFRDHLPGSNRVGDTEIVRAPSKNICTLAMHHTWTCMPCTLAKLGLSRSTAKYTLSSTAPILFHNLQLCLKSLSGSRGILECFVNSNICSGQSWTNFELQIKVHFPNRRIPDSVFVTGLQVLGSGARSMKIPSLRFKNRYRPEGGS
jgi:hypothetical protein